MKLSPEHPFAFALKCIAPVIGGNVELSTGDMEHGATRFPLLRYKAWHERRSVFDDTAQCWRVEMIIQLDYLLEDDNALKCLRKNELSEKQALQALQFGLTGKIREFLQWLTNPASTRVAPADAFKWCKYDFKLVEFVESVYVNAFGEDCLTGVNSLFVVSFLDKNNKACCTADNIELVMNMLEKDSTAYKMLLNKINN